MRARFIINQILTRPIFLKILKLGVIATVLLTSSTTGLYGMDYWKWHQDISREALVINQNYCQILDETERETATITICSQLIQVNVDNKNKFFDDRFQQTLRLQRDNQRLIDRYVSRFPSNLINDSDETYNLLKTQKLALEELAKYLTKVNLFFDFLSSTTLTDKRENEIKNCYDVGDWGAAKFLVNDCLGQTDKQGKIKVRLQEVLQQPLPCLDAYLNKHGEYLKTLSSILNAKEQGQKRGLDGLVRDATVLNLEMSLTSPEEDLQVYWEKIIVDRRLAGNKTRLLAESNNAGSR